MLRTVLTFIQVCAISISLEAENLISNSDFELGCQGFACLKTLDWKKNPELNYIGPQIEASDLDANGKALRIPNPFAEGTRLFFKEVVLKPATEYTMSVWMKSDKDALPVGVRAQAAYCPPVSKEDFSLRANFYKQFSVTQAWTRYSFTFTSSPEADLKHYTPQIEFAEKEGGPPLVLWIDRIQLNEGKLQAYEAGAGLEVSAKAGEQLYIVDNGAEKEAQAHVSAVNNSDVAVDATIKLDVINDYDKKLAYTCSRKASLKPGALAELDFKIPGMRFGAYELRPSISGPSEMRTKSIPGYFAVSGKYRGGQIDIEKDFCVGVNGGSGFQEACGPRSGYLAPGISPAESMKLLGDMGCRFMRDWGEDRVFKWRFIEPEKGKFDFTLPDKELELASANNIQIMPVLGGWEFLNFPFKKHSMSCWPDWVLDEGIRKRPEDLPAPLLVRWPQCSVYFPKMDSWRNYVKTVAERYKGRIKYYEIFNEPNFGGGNGCLEASEYLPYLEAANRVLKDVDPSSRTVGFSATGDFGGRLSYFLENSFKAGGLKYADIVSFHPYSARQLDGSSSSADAQIDEIKALIRKHNDGKEVPAWNTELYYLFNGPSNFRAGLFEAHHVAWRFLTDLGEGVGQSASVPYECIYKNLLFPNFMRWAPRLEYRPSPSFVAYNALARIFESAKPAAKRKFQNEAVCYVFRKDGISLAALWSYGGSDEYIACMDLNAKQAALLDIFGNELPFAGKEIPLGKAPVYILWRGKESELTRAVEMATLKALHPITAAGAKACKGEAGDSLFIAMRNNEKANVDGTLYLLGKNREYGFSLAPLSCGFVEAALEPAKDQIPSYLDLRVVPKASASFDATAEVQKVEGYWAHNSNAPAIAQIANPTKKSDVRGAEEGLAANFQVAYDDNAIKLKVNVRDRSPSGPQNGRKLWEQDCIELFIDPKPFSCESTRKSDYHDKVARVFILPYASEKGLLIASPRKLAAFTPENLKYEIVRTPEGYSASVEIPLNALELAPPLKGKRIGFDIAVDNARFEKVAEEQIFWSSKTGEAYKDRWGFGLLFFE